MFILPQPAFYNHSSDSMGSFYPGINSFTSSVETSIFLRLLGYILISWNIAGSGYFILLYRRPLTFRICCSSISLPPTRPLMDVYWERRFFNNIIIIAYSKEKYIHTYIRTLQKHIKCSICVIKTKANSEQKGGIYEDWQVWHPRTLITKLNTVTTVLLRGCLRKQKSRSFSRHNGKSQWQICDL